MDSSEFTERHRRCGGEIVETTTKRKRFNCYFVHGSKGPKAKTKQCSRCGQSPKKRDIVSVRHGEILGWNPA